MRGHKTDAHLGHSLRHPVEKLRETDDFTVGCLVTVRVNILPEQRHIFVTFLPHVAYLVQNAVDVAASLPSARVRHDTVGAEVIAAAHDGDEAGHVHTRHLERDHVAICFLRRQFDMDRLLAPLYGSDKVRQIHVRVGAGHQIGAVPIHQFLFDALGHTTEYPDNQMFLLLAQRLKVLQSPDDTLFGIIAHRTGIDEDCVCLTDIVRQFVSVGLHDRSHDLAIRHIHLASVCFNI